MKKLLPYLLLLPLLLPFTNARAGGGPDAFGYVWLDNNDVGGPTVTWTDTNSAWTQVGGLADDNAVGTFPIGWNFHYYWTDVTDFKVGSNGWLSFDNIGNIASCFPIIPTAGGAGDNIVAPLMSDLTFISSYPQFPNVGEVYYWSNNVDTLIVSYYNVPFWQNGVPDWVGSNTFQVVLSGVDSSITFVYQTLNSTFTNTTCTNDVGCGIENLTGNIGLGPYIDAIPPSNYAIKFYYPDSVLLSVKDLTPAWNQNNENGGVFYPTGVLPSLQTNIKNVGNDNVTSTTSITGRLQNLNFATVYTNTQTLSSLAVGADSTITYTPQANISTAGQYYFESTLTNANDLNPGNNANTSEVNVVDLTGPTATLTYSTGGASTGSINWSGGAGDDGVGIFMEPPVYPVTISSVEYFFTGVGGDYFLPRIYANDGPNGAPGTVLFSDSIPASNVTTNAWNVVTPSNSVTINSGGFYIAWFQGGANVSIATETNGPISQRSYEILGGQWAPYRSNTDQEFLIRANITGYPCVNTSGFNFTTNQDSAIFTNTSVGGTTYFWDFGDGNTSTAVSPTHGFATTGTYVVCLTTSGPCGTDSVCQWVNISCPPPTTTFSSTATGITASFTETSPTNVHTWLWDFGDGTTDNTQNPTHTFPGPGTYQVCLTVTSACGSGTFCDSVEVCALPAANFNYTSTGLVATFANFSSSATSFLWDFGDGNTSPMQNPTHTYASPGTYTVCLTATNACSSDSTCMTVNVCAPAAATFSFTQNLLNFMFQDQTSGTVTQWLWDFGDGNTSISASPNHTYSSPGAYTVCLTITDACGTDSSCQVVNATNVGIEDEMLTAFECWPNPASDQVQVKIEAGLLTGVELAITDLTGRELQRIDLQDINGVQTIRLELEQFSQGVYFIALRSNEVRATQKIMIE